MIEKIKEKLSELEPRLWELNLFLYENPETSFQEEKASQYLINMLKSEGFVVEEEVLEMKTAFIAKYNTGKKGPIIAYLCEYDALPEIGHGCGHNMIATFGVGAGILLRRLMDELGGQVWVYGTPAEETSGAKVDFVERGLFDPVDVAIMCHPANETQKSGTSLALMPLEFTFSGRSSHAAASPEKGINALEAVIQTFNNINALRQHVRDDVRIHGIITEGGVAANIIPDKSIAQFYIRALDRDYLGEVVEKVCNCAQAGALATGCTLSIRQYETAYDNLVTNEVLSTLFMDNLKVFGVDFKEQISKDRGSLDMGNVSHRVPSIHPWIGIGDQEHPFVLHTKEFALATTQSKARAMLSSTIGAMVKTGMDIILSPKLLEEIQHEFYMKGD